MQGCSLFVSLGPWQLTYNLNFLKVQICCIRSTQPKSCFPAMSAAVFWGNTELWVRKAERSRSLSPSPPPLISPSIFLLRRHFPVSNIQTLGLGGLRSVSQGQFLRRGRRRIAVDRVDRARLVFEVKVKATFSPICFHPWNLPLLASHLPHPDLCQAN